MRGNNNKLVLRLLTQLSKHIKYKISITWNINMYKLTFLQRDKITTRKCWLSIMHVLKFNSCRHSKNALYNENDTWPFLAFRAFIAKFCFMQKWSERTLNIFCFIEIFARTNRWENARQQQQQQQQKVILRSALLALKKRKKSYS